MNIMLGLYAAAVAALVMNSTWVALGASALIILIMFCYCVFYTTPVNERHE